MAKIAEFLSRMGRRLNIAVVGDAMIDEYYDVSMSRISPEFPIPVMNSSSKEPQRVPGGSANVCRQLQNFNVDPSLVAITDDSLDEILKLHEINDEKCYHLSGGDTHVPVKRRFYDKDFPVSRWDIESTNYGYDLPWMRETRRDLRDFSTKYDNAKYDMIILSNYNKGFFDREMIKFWLGKGVPTLVDPKFGSPKDWDSCTIFKPNYQEAYKMTGYQDWKDQCRKLFCEVGCEHVVITNSGTAVYGLDGRSDHFFCIENPDPKPARSVVGAGDCFSAFLAMAYCQGFSIEESAEIAFQAGQVYVREIHNKPVTPHSLLKSVDPIAAKFIAPPPVGERKGKLVFTNGCFDLLHAGHVQSLLEAKKHGDQLVVAVNNDTSVWRLKGEGRPIICLDQRMKMLAALECVDFVVSFADDGLLKLIKSIQPNVLVKGEDWSGKKITGEDEVAEVVYAPLLKGVSTSAILEKIRYS